MYPTLTDVIRLCVVCGLSSLVTPGLCDSSGEREFQKPAGMIHDLRAAVAELAGEGRTYLGRLAGEQTVLSVQKAFSQVLGVLAGGLATGLNVVAQYLVHLMQAVGVDVAFNKVTPELVIFVAQWTLVAFIGYWLISLTFGLVASTLRRTLWLLKLGGALACFGLILSDRSVGTDTIAVRLAALVCVCFLLGIGPSRAGPTAADKTAHLEAQVKTLERRVREMERWRRTEE